VRKRLSYANVVSTLALVFALGTGGAWAATQINGKLIKKNTITGNKIKKSAITHREINEEKLKAVPRAVLADTATTANSANSLAGQPASAFLPAGGTAANSEQLGGTPAGGFVRGGGSYQFGRTEAPGANPEATVKTFHTPVGQFRLSCGAANANARFFNTTPGVADVFLTFHRGAADDDTTYTALAENSDVGYSTTEPIGPVFIDLRAGKGTAMAVLRVAERRTPGGQCIWNWEISQGQSG
jgi:hypothetical protein